ncbi:MAG TPA: thermonuclease family protein [Armatimonadota bacterium]|nr:thermonuclease family protein [Armatimonadota bacterium]
MPRFISPALLALSLIGALGAPISPIAAAPAGRLTTYDTCVRVLEGDLIEGKTVGQIRLIGVIAPAQGEPGFQQAVAYTSKLALGKQIKLDICDKRPNDFRQRLRAVVYLPDGTNLNTKLLRAGYAKVLDHQPCHINATTWQIYEDGARSAKLGFWATAAQQMAGAALAPQSKAAAKAAPVGHKAKVADTAKPANSKAKATAGTKRISHKTKATVAETKLAGHKSNAASEAKTVSHQAKLVHHKTGVDSEKATAPRHRTHTHSGATVTIRHRD